MITTPKIVPSEKLLNLPTYIFAELDEWKAQARAEGKNLIDLGIGNPDGSTPEPIVQAAVKSIQDPKSHGYPDFKGKLELRQTIAEWMMRKYNAPVDPETEIQTLVGAKEGIAHIAMAYTNPGDINIVPDPYYPVHSRGTWISNGDVYHIKLEKSNGFLPDLNAIPEDIAKRAKLFFVNYPNNPTVGIATREFYEELIDYCKTHSILLVTDLAYGEICYDGYKPLSILSIPGGKDIAIEFHTCSKTFNMAGWRVGWACGNKEYIKALYAMKTNIDYGTSSIVQDAAIAALNIEQSYIDGIVNKYKDRRDFMVSEFRKLGWDLDLPKASMYLWLKVPDGYDSKSWCKMVLDKVGVVFTPGIAFGNFSDDHFRVSLVANQEKMEEAFSRLASANIRYC